MKIPKILLFLFVFSACFGSPNSFYFFNETDAEYRQLNNSASIYFIEEMDSRGYDYNLKPFHYYDMENVSYGEFSYQFFNDLVVIWNSDLYKVHIQVWNLGERVYESMYWQKNFRTDEKMAEQIALDLDYFVKSSSDLWKDSSRKKDLHKHYDNSGISFHIGFSGIRLSSVEMNKSYIGSHDLVDIEFNDNQFTIPSIQANCFVRARHFLLDLEFASNLIGDNDYTVGSITANYVRNVQGTALFAGLGAGYYSLTETYSNECCIPLMMGYKSKATRYSANGPVYVLNTGITFGTHRRFPFTILIKQYIDTENFKRVGSNFSIGFSI